MWSYWVCAIHPYQWVRSLLTGLLAVAAQVILPKWQPVFRTIKVVGIVLQAYQGHTGSTCNSAAILPLCCWRYVYGISAGGIHFCVDPDIVTQCSRTFPRNQTITQSTLQQIGRFALLEYSETALLGHWCILFFLTTLTLHLSSTPSVHYQTSTIGFVWYN